MDAYRNTIDTLISREDGEVVLNGSTGHAAIVIERMLSRALDKMRILTRSLDPLIYCDDAVLRSALDFARSGKELLILIEEYSDSDIKENDLFVKLGKFSNVEIRQVPEDLRDPIQINFSLMDNRGFRIEKDERGATAIVSFGNRDMNSRLDRLFANLWSKSLVVSSNPSVAV